MGILFFVEELKGRLGVCLNPNLYDDGSTRNIIYDSLLMLSALSHPAVSKELDK